MSRKIKVADRVSLYLHWRDQKCELVESNGLIGCQINGAMTSFLSTETDKLEVEWQVLLGFERAHGWLCITIIKAPQGFCLNERALSAGPILIKESSLMMPPHSKDCLDLFLTDSLKDIQPAVGQILFKTTPKQKSEKFASIESVQAQAFNDYFDAAQACNYGLVDENHNFTELDVLYRFGALSFEMTDEECWVFAVDGVLKVNGVTCSASQIFVGDYVTWQHNNWFVVGCASARRLEPLTLPLDKIKHDVQAVVASLTKTTALVPVNQVQPGQFILKPAIEDEPCLFKDHKLDQDYTHFRAKVESWMAFGPVTPDQPYNDDHVASMPSSSRSKMTTAISDLALLRLGKKSYVRQDYLSRLLSEPSVVVESKTKKVFRHLTSPLAISLAFSSVLLILLVISLLM